MTYLDKNGTILSEGCEVIHDMGTPYLFASCRFGAILKNCFGGMYLFSNWRYSIYNNVVTLQEFTKK